MLKGEKVLLRPIKKSDIYNLATWVNDQEVNQFTSHDLPMAEVMEEQWFEKKVARTDSVILVVEAIDCEEPKPIGSCGIHGIHMIYRNAGFGIMIGEKDYWEKGYGSEAAQLIINFAFYRLNLNRISSAVLDFNPRSLALHKKLGFKEEGRKRESFYKNGRYCDEIIFGLLRKEWEEMKK
ncbi:MAG: GNAT family protein [bacterium]